jgi:hypothetical protein
MTSNISAVLTVITAHGDRLGDSVDVGLAVIGAILSYGSIARRQGNCRLVRSARRGIICGL